jgi:hypothetical protein
MLQTFMTHATGIAGVVMLLCQAVLCVGNLLGNNFNAGMYWGGGLLLTVGALRMSGGI